MKKNGPADRINRTAKLCQKKLSEQADIHRNYIGLIERDEQNVTIKSLLNMAKALKCKVLDLVVDAEI